MRSDTDRAGADEWTRRAACGWAAAELNPWAVEFRYEAGDEPALDRHATLELIECIRRWAEEQIQAVGP